MDRKTFQQFLKNKSGVLGLTIILVYLILAVFAGQISPYSATEMHPEDRMQPPNTTYLLGTDEFGRDTLSRLIYGARVSLKVAILSVAIAIFPSIKDDMKSVGKKSSGSFHICMRRGSEWYSSKAASPSYEKISQISSTIYLHLASPSALSRTERNSPLTL